MFKIIGQKLRKLRISRSLTQMELELAADMAPGSISRIENGKINPTKETLIKLGQVLQLNKHEYYDLFCIEEFSYTNTSYLLS